MEEFLELFVSATASGCIYGLVALSYLVIIRPTSVINFALGEWAASGAFVGVAVLSTFVWPGLEWPWWSALVIVAAFGALIGYGTERLTVRPLIARGAPELNTLLFGASPLPSPAPFGFRRMLIGPLPGVSQQFLIIGMTGAIFLAAWLFFERTVLGRAFEAVALNRKAAALMGIDLRKVGALSFAAGGAIAAVAGLLVSPLTSAHFLMGLPLAIQGFSALVIGGVGRVEGALLGGLILAFVEQFSARWLPIPSGLTVAFPFALLIFFLLFRPTGLLRAPETRV